MKNKKGVLWGGIAALTGAAMILFVVLYSGAPISPKLQQTPSAKSYEEGKELTFLPDQAGGVAGMKLTAVQGSLGLYYSPETAEIAVKDHESGSIWYSNPLNRGEDTTASLYEQESLSSQFSLEYRDARTNLFQFRSYPDSAANGQFTAEAIDNGVRVIYTLGDTSNKLDQLPKYITVDRLEEAVLSKLDEETARYVSLRYYKVKDNPNLLERLDEQVSKELVLNKMLAAFEKAGYDEEQLAIDNEQNEVEYSTMSSKPAFVVPLEYRLSGNGLQVRIPMSKVEENPAYPLHRIHLLEYFGAAGPEASGYMLVPDGSGALIYLNNGKVTDDRYSQAMYGGDHTQSSRNRLQVAQSARLPVYGLKNGAAAWFAVIEDGDAISSVNADIGGKLNAFNHVYSSFEIRAEDDLMMMSGNKLTQVRLTSDDKYEGDVQVEYLFLQGDEASYAGMAKRYQEKLLAGNESGTMDAAVEEASSDSPDLPFHVDVVGAITRQSSFLGVPYSDITALTTLEEARQIGEELNAAGISNLQMRLLGWSKGGMNHKPSAAALQGEVGSKKELAELTSWLEEQGGGLYADVAFQKVYHDTLSFSPSQDAARFITREVAEQSPYRRDVNRMSSGLYGSYYLLSPAKLPYFIDQFLKGADKLKVSGIALRDLGDELNGDYRVSRPVHRQLAKEIVEGELAKIHHQQECLIIEGGNSYALPYADYVVGAPDGYSGFNILDEEVPFYQMVLHGYIGYAGEPVNLQADQDKERALLKVIEYGAAPYFVFTEADSSKVKFTAFDYLYSTQYTTWLETAAEMYKQANEVLGPLQSVNMVDHQMLQEGVYKTVYENGAYTIVNYNDYEVQTDGHVIEAKDYVAGGNMR